MLNMFSLQWNAVVAEVRKKRLSRTVIRKAGLVLCTFLLLSVQQVSAQDSLSVTGLQKDASAANWHLFRSANGVSVYYQFISCGPAEQVFFKVVNTSSQALNISWNYQLFQEHTMMDVNPDDVNVKLQVAPGASVSGGCNAAADKLLVFIRETGTTGGVETIKLNNLSITPVQ